MTLADWLSHSGTSLSALASRCGVAPSTVHRWKDGQRTPRREQMNVLTRATGGAVTANDFQEPAAVGSAPPGLSQTQAQLVAEASALGLDAAAIAEKAVREAVGRERARRWMEQNREAIGAHNRHIETHGLPLEEHRMF